MNKDEESHWGAFGAGVATGMMLLNPIGNAQATFDYGAGFGPYIKSIIKRAEDEGNEHALELATRAEDEWLYGNKQRSARILREARDSLADPSVWGRKPNVTDRALRYRANADPPDGPRVCAYCGSRRNVEIHHLDGREENTRHSNLVWACRSCNTRIGAAHTRRGIGRRTQQYNPGGAKSWEQYADAVASTHGEGSLFEDQAADLIHDTSARKRSQFQKDIWDIRRKKYPPCGWKKGCAGDVPF